MLPLVSFFYFWEPDLLILCQESGGEEGAHLPCPSVETVEGWQVCALLYR